MIREQKIAAKQALESQSIAAWLIKESML